MKQEVKLPYCSRYFPGKQIKLGWLKAITSNNYISARHLNWHDHDEMELIFPLRGHYRYEFKKKKTVLVDSGSFIVIPEGTRHRLHEAIDPPGSRLHLYLRKPSNRMCPTGTFTAQEYARLYQSLARQTLKSIPVSPLLKTLIPSLGQIITKGSLPLSNINILQVRLLCSLLLCKSTKSHTNAINKSPSQTLEEAVSWLKSNYSTCINLNQLVEHIGYSRARFFALFKRQTNMTPSEYLRNYRLEKAKELLLQTNRPAIQIGKSCGFGDPAHFSRLFSKMTGYTPLAYRRKRKRIASA